MIAEMDKLEIVCLKTDLEDLASFLQEQGLLHVEHVPLAVENAAGYLHRVHLSDEQKAEVNGLERLDTMLREMVPLLTTHPPREDVLAATTRLSGDWNLETCRRNVRGWSRELRSLTRRRINIRDNIEVLNNFRKTLRTLEPLFEARDAVLGRNARALLFQGDVERLLAALRKRLRTELGQDCELKHRRLSRNSVVALVTHPETRFGSVSEILDEEGVSPIEVSAKELRGHSLDEALEQLDAQIASHEKTLSETRDRLDAFSKETGAEVAAMRLAVADRLAQLRVLDNFAASEMVGVVHGWAPRHLVPAFKEALAVRFGGTAVAAEIPTDNMEPERIPTLLTHHTATEPFEVLLSLFKPATYGTYDPTVLVGVFFVGFYGFILGDVAYGAILLLLAYLARRRWGHIDLVRSVCHVAMYCGVSAIFFGVMFGEFLGDLGRELFNMPQLWFHRGHDTERLLLIAVIIGVGHVVLSLVLAIREGFRHRNRKHAIEKLGLLFGQIAVGIGAMSYADLWPYSNTQAAVAAVSLLILSIAMLLHASGALMPVHMLEVISLVSNILSYSRLMALGLASVILADIANEVGGKPANIVLGIIVGGLLHAVNLVIGIFSPTLHSLRLNYVEFLPKFYEPQGRSYEPFRKETLW